MQRIIKGQTLDIITNVRTQILPKSRDNCNREVFITGESISGVKLGILKSESQNALATISIYAADYVKFPKWKG